MAYDLLPIENDTYKQVLFKKNLNSLLIIKPNGIVQLNCTIAILAAYYIRVASLIISLSSWFCNFLFLLTSLFS